MLRQMLGSGRRPLPPNPATESSSESSSSIGVKPDDFEGVGDATQETWIDWIRSTTNTAEEQFSWAGLEDLGGCSQAKTLEVGWTFGQENR